MFITNRYFIQPCFSQLIKLFEQRCWVVTIWFNLSTCFDQYINWSYAVKSVKIHEINAVTNSFIIHHSSIEWDWEQNTVCVFVSFFIRVNWSDCWLIYLFIWFAWLNIYTNVKINSFWIRRMFHLCVYHQTSMILVGFIWWFGQFWDVCGRISSVNLTTHNVASNKFKWNSCIWKRICSRKFFQKAYFFLLNTIICNKKKGGDFVNYKSEQKSQILYLYRYHMQSNLYLGTKTSRKNIQFPLNTWNMWPQAQAKELTIQLNAQINPNQKKKKNEEIPVLCTYFFGGKHVITYHFI